MLKTSKETVSEKLFRGLKVLGFDTEINESLFFVVQKSHVKNVEILFHLEKAEDFKADAIFVRKQLTGSFKPQVYLYDFTDQKFEENVLTNIQKKIWSSGEAPLACIFYDTEIKILNCTTHTKENDTPEYLETLQITAEVNKQFNSYRLKTGMLWEGDFYQKKFKFQNSSYDMLIRHIKGITESISKLYSKVHRATINKLIIQSILIKYLEERVDQEGNRLFSEKYFKKFGDATTFTDVLRLNGKSVDLFEDLNRDFNGNIFYWIEEEKNLLRSISLVPLANALDGDVAVNAQKSIWRYYEFNYVPVELISRLYEEFLGENKQEKGLYYTPSHLAQLLVDEALPLKNYNSIDFNDFKVLDPSCGSGIFLVVVFKRLIQYWRLKNGLKRPGLKELKQILASHIFGIDLEPQAVRLTAFSLCLSLCDELTPKQIIEELQFIDLTKTNIIGSDFFKLKDPITHNYDFIIGNPPFKRGSVKEYNATFINGSKVKIPQGQIALKFLSESLKLLKPSGLSCLIIKASGLLYNTTSTDYKKMLFSNFNVVQILDFSGLGRNNALWEGADVAAAAVFIKNETPNFNKNILHLTFRRTKATNERIIFEIDDYDLHFVNRNVAIHNNFIWKNNLLGGGRIKALVERVGTYTLENFLHDNNCFAEEGYIIGKDGTLSPSYMHQIPTLPTDGIDEHEIDYSKLTDIPENTKFVKVPPEGDLYFSPNIILWENIGTHKLPVFFNDVSFSFKDKLIGIKSRNDDVAVLKKIVQYLKMYSNFLRFYIFVTSSQVLINKNTAVLKADWMRLPFIENNGLEFTEVEKNIIRDVNVYMEEAFRHGENSQVVKPILKNQFESFISHYGLEFCRVLNVMYERDGKRFKLQKVITLNEEDFIATIFSYDSDDIEPSYQFKAQISDLEALLKVKRENLSSQRILKYYLNDSIIIIKPNQRRYWISLMAYRDADKYFADSTKLKN